jgi:hypothetical protein
MRCTSSDFINAISPIKNAQGKEKDAAFNRSLEAAK